MSNTFRIEITAVDKITKVVNRINAKIGDIFRPITKLKRDFQQLSKASNLGRLTGALRNVKKAASGVVDQLRAVASPMLAVIGGGTLAGLVALTAEWGHLGLEVTQTAQSLGLSTQALQAWRGEAMAVGLSAQSLDAGMKTLGDTLEDALFGRNATALVMMNRIGLSIHRTKDGAIDTSRAMLDLSRVLSSIRSPQVQGLVARQFGVESLLPLLRQGPQAIQAYQRRVVELGGVMSADATAAAERFGLSLNFLKISALGLRNSIGAHLIPVLQPLIEQLTSWISANRELIAIKIAAFAKGFADALQRIDFGKVLDGATKFLSMIDKIVTAVGGWKNVAIGFGTVMALNMIAPILSLTMALFALAPALLAAWPVIAAIAAIGGAAIGGLAAFGGISAIKSLGQNGGGVNVGPPSGNRAGSNPNPFAVAAGTAGVVQSLPPLSLTPPPAQTLGPQDVNLKVQMDHAVRTDGNVTSRVVPSTSPWGVPLNIGTPNLAGSTP